MRLNEKLKENNRLAFNFKTRHAGIAALTNIAVLTGLVILNLIVQKIPADWDMTRKKLFSLTDQTTALLEKMDQPVQIYFLAKPGQEPKNILEVLEKYDQKSKGVTLEVIDPNRNPALINRYAENGQDVSLGSVIVVSGLRSRIIEGMDLYSLSYTQEGKPQVVGMTIEQRVTAALSFVITGREPLVYELEGHNEKTLESLNFLDPMAKANFKTEKLNLLKEGKVPDNAEILVILSPKRDLSDGEVQGISSFLNRGGALFLGMDLNLSGESYSHFEDLLNSYNVTLQQGVVMEKDTNRLLSGQGNNPLFFSPRFPETNPITDPLGKNSLDVFLFTAMGIGETPVQKRNMKVTPLLNSSNKSWLRTDLNEPSESRVGSDIPGPIMVAASIAETNRDTGEEDGAKIVLLTSSGSLSPMSGLGQIKANVEFYLSSLNWLSGQEEAINISSKSLFRLPLKITALQAWIYAGITILLIPLLIIICGTVIHFRRKNL